MSTMVGSLDNPKAWFNAKTYGANCSATAKSPSTCLWEFRQCTVRGDTRVGVHRLPCQTKQALQILLPAKLLQFYQDNYANEKDKREEITRKISKMRLIISGSAPLPSTIFRKWDEITGTKILERYGMTETCMILSNPLKPELRKEASIEHDKYWPHRSKSWHGK